MIVKWTVADDGKFCAEHGIFLESRVEQISLGMFATTGAPEAKCGFIYRLGDEFYACASDSDRSAPAFKRVVKR